MNSFNYILAFIVLLIPPGIVWLALYLRIRKYLKTALSYCAFILCSLIFVYLYFLLTMYISVEYAGDNLIVDLTRVVSVVVLVYLGWPLTILFFVTLFLYFAGIQKKN